MNTSSSTPPPLFNSPSRHDLFSALISQATSLNTNCLSLSNQFTDLVGPLPESNEVQLTTVRTLAFHPLSNHELEKIFLLSVEGEKKTIILKSLKSCFFSAMWTVARGRAEWKNLLRTPLPEIAFFDLKREIEVYELLDPQKERAFEELNLFVQGLEKIQQELEQRIQQVKREIGLGERVLRLFNDKMKSTTTTTTTSTTTTKIDEKIEIQTKQLYFVMKAKDPFIRKVKVEFEIEFSNERVVAELENFETLIHQYYEVAPNQNEPKERHQREEEKRERKKKEKDERERSRRFPDSPLIQDQDEKDLLINWMKDSRKGGLKKTILLYRASRDGYSGEDFHSRCDSQGSTLVVFRTTDGRRGGGYSHVSWHSNGVFTDDPEKKNFLFSLDHRTKHNYKGNTGQAIEGYAGFGPRFGGGADLALSSDCHTNCTSYSEPSSYALPNSSHLAGSRKFQVSDYEVWKIE